MPGEDKGIRARAHVDGALLDSFVASLREKMAIASMVVFGSRATGEDLEESDYDILVLSPDFKACPPHDRVVRLLETWPGSVALEPVAMTPEEFREAEGALVWDMLADGLVIEDDGTFEAKRRLFRGRLERGELVRGDGYWSFS